MNNACGAAFRDSRFPPVEDEEMPELQIEVSVLTLPTPLDVSSPQELLHKLRPHVDGVVLKLEGRTATFLPQVWEMVPDAARFMDELARKARLPVSAWRQPDAVVLTYQVESFEEAQPGG
jgi:AmmeMemoRadiSam system protein A